MRPSLYIVPAHCDSYVNNKNHFNVFKNYYFAKFYVFKFMLL